MAFRALLPTRPILRSTISTLGHRFASTHPIIIKPSENEILSGRLAPRNLEKAIRSLHEDGLVVIENAIPQKDLDHLNTRMVQDALHLQSRGKDMPFNYNVGNSTHPPLPQYQHQTNTNTSNPQSNKTHLQSSNTSPPQSSSILSPRT
jgi:hypothetical protein